MPPAIYCFHDETGEEDMSAGYYMVVMVVLMRGNPIDKLHPFAHRRASPGGEPAGPMLAQDLSDRITNR